MTFALVSAPATFSLLMRKLLKGMDKLDSFQDDILVFTETLKSHLLILRQLFLRLRRAKLTARTSKCFIGFHKLESLGHLVSDGR